MTSFVREILSASGKLGDKEDLNTKTARLAKKVDELKANIRKDVQDRYAEYLSNGGETEALASKMRAAAEEVEQLKVMLNSHLRPEVGQATKDMQAVLKQMKELQHTVQVSFTSLRRSRHDFVITVLFQSANMIREADTAMNEANTCLDEGDYLNATIKLK